MYERGMMGGPQGMMGGPQGPPDGRGIGGMRGRQEEWFGRGGGGHPGWEGHPSMRGSQPTPPPGMEGGGWGDLRGHVLRPGDEFWEPWMGEQGGGGMVGPIGAYPNMPPQFRGGPPAGMGDFRQPGFVSGGPDDPARGGSGYWGGRGMPGGFGGRPPAGPPILRRPGRDRY